MIAEVVGAPLQIALFGPFDVRIDGKPIRSLRTRKGQWLLALLALRQGREVARAWLAGVLWPDSPDSQALYSLRRSLTDLRDALMDQAEHIGAPGARSLSLEKLGCRSMWSSSMPPLRRVTGRRSNAPMRPDPILN